jgi:phosphatidylserine/phosphatidylglycerophosphate/cardiolipin synthase-like enzyme
LSLEGKPVQVADSDVEFLGDTTGGGGKNRVYQQVIFDRAIQLIREAEDFVLVDFFLFNEFPGKNPNGHRKLCRDITTALLDTKRQRPKVHMVIITDPVNEAYGGPVPRHFQELERAGIPVVRTDLVKLRDSNPLYSGFWRLIVQWFGKAERGPWPHPFSPSMGGVGARSWLALLNFKANHRKLIVADAPGPDGTRRMACLVSSANPHDASSAHSNVGLLVRDGPWREVLQGEDAILKFSGFPHDVCSWLPSYATNSIGPSAGQHVQVRVLTEGKIRKGLVEAIGGVQAGGTIDVAMFYLAERTIVEALVKAAARGVPICLLLDPNRDAFGYQKNGIPNRPVAAELFRRGRGRISIRWHNTQGEQFHTKMVLVKHRGQGTLFVGSANLTRRNIGDFNLETDLVVSGGTELTVIKAASGYFERLWRNQGAEYSVPYSTFAETSRSKYWLYRIQERTGTSTF